MLIYIANPIDRAGSLVHDRVSSALQAIQSVQATGKHPNLVTYHPGSAFRVTRDSIPNTNINNINYKALDTADRMLVLWPNRSKSWGVPAEVHHAVMNGKHVAIVTETEPTWAMQYPEGVKIYQAADTPSGWRETVLEALAWLNNHRCGMPDATDMVDITQVAYPDGFPLSINSPKLDEVLQGIGDAAKAFLSKPHDLGDLASRMTPYSIQGTGRKALATESEAEEEAPADGPLEEKPPTVFLLMRENGGAPEVVGTLEKPEEANEWAEETLPVRAIREIDYRRLPSRAHSDDAGLDLYVSDTVVIQPGEFLDVPTNVGTLLPEGTWGFLVGRSSTLRNKGLMVNPGVIDVGYTGELFSAVWNLTNKPVLITKGERISQLILLPNLTEVVQPKFVDEFEVVTERGEKAFGSSGA